MFKRIFSLFFGLGLGVLVGAFVIKRVDDATKAVAPENLAANAGRVAGLAMERFRAAYDETRAAAAEREAELRQQFNVPTARDLLGPR